MLFGPERAVHDRGLGGDSSVPGLTRNHHLQGQFFILSAFSIENFGKTWHLYCNSLQVPGLTRRRVGSYNQVVAAIAEGQASRQTASTNMNEHSSRSHCMLQVYVQGEDSDGSTSYAKLSLVDLAGCERVARSGATGQRLKEATSINSSLSALGDVIAALSVKSNKAKHVPYRNCFADTPPV